MRPDLYDHLRFSRQCAAILVRLRQSPATNRELVQIAMNLTARISDLRAHGLKIEAKPLGGGLFEYRLVQPVEEQLELLP
jgi:hypothetical protein